MEYSLSTEIEVVGQSTTASNGDWVYKKVKPDTLKQYSNETFSEIMSTMTSELGNK